MAIAAPAPSRRSVSACRAGLRHPPTAPCHVAPASVTTGRVSRAVSASGHLPPAARLASLRPAITVATGHASSCRSPRSLMAVAALLLSRRLLPYLLSSCCRRRHAGPPRPSHVRRPRPIPIGLTPAAASSPCRRCHHRFPTATTTTQPQRRRQPSTPLDPAKAVRIWAGVSAADNDAFTAATHH